MCIKTFYAIFDRTPMIRVVTESYGELNQIMTGMSLDREEYTCPVIDRRQARALNKELSNRILNLQGGKNEQA